MQPHEFWQEIEPAAIFDAEGGDAFHPALFDDGRVLRLPIRPLADGERAIALLILNQASLPVAEAIARQCRGLSHGLASNRLQAGNPPLPGLERPSRAVRPFTILLTAKLVPASSPPGRRGGSIHDISSLATP